MTAAPWPAPQPARGSPQASGVFRGACQVILPVASAIAVMPHRNTNRDRHIELAEQRDRIGICLDTCHAFAAGYDLSTEAGYRSTFSELNELVGAERLACIHLNDSKHPLGSRKDRHENVGAGLLGLGFFERVIHDAAFSGMAMVLETPLGDDDLGHQDTSPSLRAICSTSAAGGARSRSPRP